MEFFGRPEFEAAAQAVQARIHVEPRVGIVLGSGLGALADSVEQASIISYPEIPHWPVSTVVGHSGQLHVGQLEGHPVMVMRGRAHYYEGYPISQVTLPIRVMQILGVKVLILTNAAGGLNQTFLPGELMLITDHINLLGHTGVSPLRGPNDESLGPRFPAMTRVYDPELCRLAMQTARDHDVPMHQGVYIALAGPAFETPADIRFLRSMGADAVGMSTVPEATVARHAHHDETVDRRLRVLAISGISNSAIDNPASEQEASHQEVLEASSLIVPRLETIIRGVLRQLPAIS